MSDKKIMELESQLALMQEEIDRLKHEKEQADNKKLDPFIAFQPRLDKVQTEAQEILKEMSKDHEVVLASMVIGVCRARGGLASGTGMLTCTDIDDIVEEGLATALDVFSNPRRIAVLKALMHESSTGSEIAQKTGLVGGQLYHHLSILENAKLIFKGGDKYEIQDNARLLLGGLNAAIGGMEIARPEENLI